MVLNSQRGYDLRVIPFFVFRRLTFVEQNYFLLKFVFIINLFYVCDVQLTY